MKSRNSLKWSLSIASIVGIASFLIIIINLPVRGSSAKPVSTAINQTKASKKPVNQVDLGLPARLVIPKIKVDTSVESIGLTPQGAVDVPKGPINVAWFNRSVHPGDNGSAVITGHYGYWKNGKLGVFNNLSKLSKGDKIYIKDKQGVTITFVVRELKIYGPNDSVPAVFVAIDGKAHLNLITCLGVWNKATKSYPKRLVVFADKE